jgi:hypothetical protein
VEKRTLPSVDATSKDTSFNHVFMRNNHLALNFVVIDQLERLGVMKHLNKSSYQTIELFIIADQLKPPGEDLFKLKSIQDTTAIDLKRKEMGISTVSSPTPDNVLQASLGISSYFLHKRIRELRYTDHPLATSIVQDLSIASEHQNPFWRYGYGNNRRRRILFSFVYPLQPQLYIHLV